MPLKTLASIILGSFLGGIAAVICCELFRDSPSLNDHAFPQVLEVSVNAELFRRLDAMSQSIAELKVALGNQLTRPSVQPERGSPEILSRLEQLEGSLVAIAQQLEKREKTGEETPSTSRAKDSKAVADASVRGLAERKLNTQDLWGSTPRELLARFGRPDSTQYDDKTGHLDWFYFGPEENGSARFGLEGGAVQVRFLGGVVVEVWP